MISFGNKIEFANCRVLDRKSGTFKPAKIYEFDCNDASDICYMAYKSPKKWNFRKCIYEDMIHKYKYKNLSQMAKLDHIKNSRYFVLEADDKSLISACEAIDSKKDIEIHYINSIENDKYKYGARALLAALTKYNLRENKGTVVIPIPTAASRGYYVKACGFSEQENAYLTLEHKNPQDFVKENDNKVKINLLV